MGTLEKKQHPFSKKKIFLGFWVLKILGFWVLKILKIFENIIGDEKEYPLGVLGSLRSLRWGFAIGILFKNAKPNAKLMQKWKKWKKWT